MSNDPDLRPETRIVHGTRSCFTTSRDLVAPIHMTSTFTFADIDQGSGVFSGTRDGYVYTRINNPTVDLLQEKVALLEGGEDAAATASGMAAVSSVLMGLLIPGDNFIACNAVYGGTFALFQHHLPGLGMDCRFVSPAQGADRKNVESLIDARTRLMFMETPANPTLDIIDIELWADIARNHRIPLVVDNTFASPYLQQPILLGADMVVHSATKYLGGHGDLVGGILVGSRAMVSRIREAYLHHFGPILSPFNAWLIQRGLKTLAVRMERHSDNAMAIAERLEAHPKVTRVYYPGLPNHPNHPIAKKQMTRFSGVMAFEVTGGLEAGKAVLNSVNLCSLAVSLGDCETLIQHPSSMTHSTYTPEERRKAGIADGLIRLSVGLENPNDIIDDLEQALSKMP